MEKIDIVIPQSERETVYRIALARTEKEATETLEEWETKHRAKVERILQAKEFSE